MVGAIFRGLGWLLLMVLALVALLAAAWLPFNLPSADVPAQPLRLSPWPLARTLPDDRNAAFVLEALAAEPGRDPRQAGQALWKATLAHAALPARQRAAAPNAHEENARQLLGAQIKWPGGPPMHCGDAPPDCVETWFADVEALARQRDAFAAYGQRCEQWLGTETLAFEELLVPQTAPDTVLGNLSPLMHCGRWFRSGAVVALARGQRDKVVEWMRRTDRLQRAHQEGAYSLVSHALNLRLASFNYTTMVALAMREPRLADTFAPWVAGPLDTRPLAMRWLRHEAATSLGTVDYLVRDGMTPPDLSWVPDDFSWSPWGKAVWSRLAYPLVNRGVGMLPEMTRQRLATVWQRKLDQMNQSWPELIAGSAVEGASSRAPLRWRNTLGEAMADEAARSAFAPYFARHADHELHREATALVLALIKQQVPPAQRAAVARRLAPNEDLRTRMQWSADGRRLDVRTWQSETRGAPFQAARDGIVFVWP